MTLGKFCDCGAPHGWVWSHPMMAYLCRVCSGYKRA